MSFTRASLARGTALITYNSGVFWPQGKIDLRRLPTWQNIMNGMFGPIDAFKNDLVIKIPFRLWGAYENLSKLFPSYIMSGLPGGIFGSSDVPLVVQGRDNSTVTFVNAQLTKMSNLFLGVDSDLFAADVEFTALIGNGLAPEAASSYTTLGTNSYADATYAFAKSAYVRTRFDVAWGAITGFTAVKGQKGINISWDAAFTPCKMDGYGTVDLTFNSMIAQAKMIPVGPTVVQMKTNSQEETAMGNLASAVAGDLVCTGNNSGPVITLKNAFIKESGIVYDQNELRIGEATWQTTRGFSSGAAVATAVAA